MPRARRNREPSPPVEVEEPQDDMDVDEEEEGAHVLGFNEPLTWRAGKPIAVAELLRRLKALYEELQGIQQEDAHRTSTVPKAQELASALLLGHKDSGVKAFTILCIIEMFRILAPDAPYKPSQLKEIFNLFVSTIIPALGKPSDPYNAQHLKALESLVTVKSVLLIQDAPGADNLILELFTNCFDVVSGNIRGGDGEQISKNVEFNMTAMLIALVDESPTLPPGVIDVMLAQFLRADPSVLPKKKGESQPVPARDVSPAYNMARSVCNSCADKMIRHIGQYFNAVLIDATQTTSTTKHSKTKGKKRTHDESDDESDNGLVTPPSEADLEEVAKAHRLLRELWRSCPEVIQNVVPQIEAELGAENLPLRLMAVETIGDMIAGIGAAGPPPPAVLEPAAWPPQSLDTYTSLPHHSVLLTPAAPCSFSSAYPSGYQAFFDRFRDKSSMVRSAWATAVARIILTNAGGKGLENDQETTLLRCFADCLQDHDEKVRISVIHGIAEFDFHSISQKLGSFGGVKVQGSILGNLVERIRDNKTPVRTAAIELLGRIWGVAAAAITEGSDRIRDLFGELPARILEVAYVNDKELNALLQRVMWEYLLPISFPPSKPKASNGESQRIAESQTSEERAYDPDRIRAERILTLVRDLGERSRTVFFSMQHRQPSLAKYMASLIDNAEKIKGGKGDDPEAEARLAMLVKNVAKTLPDPAESENNLKVFANHYDRRNFSLVRFCLSPESDYKKVANAMKELTKRLESVPGNVPDCLETVIPFLRSASVLVYNRSHVPAIMDISRTDEKGLGQAAHQTLKEIAAKTPEVFKVHIKDLCESLKKQAPTATTPNDPGAVDSLKACAGFARHFPEELGKERDFYKAMVNFALYGAPPRAAKHAVTVIISSAQKKEMYIKDITKCIKGFKLEQPGSLAKLASLAQLRLLASDETDDQDDAITEIATQVLASNDDAEEVEASWTEDLDEGVSAKLWALKIVVNSLRGRVIDAENEEPSEQVKDLSSRVFRLLNTLIEKDGELSKSDNTTPKQHRSQLRLAAAKLILKLCCNRVLERQFSPRDFNRLTRIVQDALPEVRAAFSVTLKKYLSLGKLPRRFYGLMFLYAFEPIKDTKERTVTFLKSRANSYSKAGDSTLEGVLSHFISLLAHHQDFAPDDLEDFVDYTLFYLKIVATEKNLPILYSVVQKLKSVQDGIDPDKSENLYILSDLVEAVIRYFADFKGWSLQIIPAKPKLPAGLFASMPSHAMAQEISEKQFLPEDFVDALEGIVRDRMRTKKRRAPDDASKASKKARTSTAKTPKAEKAEKVRKPPKQPKATKTARTPKRPAGDAVPSSDRRKSSRTSNAKSYAGMEGSDSEEEDEVEQWEQTSDVDEEANKENEELTSTPPTSDPLPVPVPVPVPANEKPTPRNAKAAARKRASPPKKSKGKATTKLPARGSGRTRNAKKERDIMSIPSDSDEELSDAPSALEA